MKQENLLEVKQLRTEFFSSKTSSVTAVNEISFSIGKGEIARTGRRIRMWEKCYFSVDYGASHSYQRKGYKR